MKLSQDPNQTKFFTCQLCGKTDKDVDMWVGSYLNYAHHECAKIGHKAIYLYLRTLYYDMWGIRVFAEDIIKLKEKEERKLREMK